MLLSLTIAAAEDGGFNPLNISYLSTALWTWIILLLALPAIWKMVMGPITRALDERDAKAQAAIVAAERASSEAQRAQAEVEKKLVEARAEASKMIAEAQRRAELRENDLMKKAERKAADLEAAAQRAIEAEREKAIAAIREEVVDLTIRAATRVIERNVGSDDDRRLVRDMVAKPEMARKG